MNETEQLAYLAGIFDGEGCVGIYGDRLVVQVSMTDKAAVEMLHAKFGGMLKPYEGVGNRKPQWRWMIAANKAVAFLQAVIPYLQIKRTRAFVAISFQSGLFYGNHITEEEQMRRAKHRLLMSRLNQRGKVEEVAE